MVGWLVLHLRLVPQARMGTPSLPHSFAPLGSWLQPLSVYAALAWWLVVLTAHGSAILWRCVTAHCRLLLLFPTDVHYPLFLCITLNPYYLPVIHS